MSGLETLLACLQQADSAFPGGAFAFSGGLETLAAEEALTPVRLEAFLADQLRGRWAPCERVVLVLAFRAAAEPEALAALDEELDALTQPAELRRGSRRQGRALLSTHRRLGTPGVAAYAARIAAGTALGHLPVVQGLAWRGAGLSEPLAEAAAAQSFCAGQLSAAVRLGRLGPLQAQAIRSALAPLLAALLRAPVPPQTQPWTFAPAADIAALRHEDLAGRLFAN